MIDLVISAYRDNLSWVEPLRRPGVKVWVYDKWDGYYGTFRELPVGADVEYRQLPNVGKLDHTFLHHVAENYDSLAPWTVFTPDGPHDHLPAGVDMAGCLEPGECLKVPRLWRGRDWKPDGRLNWEAFASIPDRNGTNWHDRYTSGKITPAKLPFVEWARKYVGYDVNGPDWPGYQPGAILGVPRKAITYLPREFYARLREQLAGSREPEEGHYMERCWVSIFTGKARYQPEEVTV